jgi:hypothetical protein
MPALYNLSYKTPRVVAGTLDLLEDESTYVRTLTALEMSVLRQMTFPRVYYPWSLVEDLGQVQYGVLFPPEYQEALETLELKLSPASPDEGGSVGEIYVDRGDLPGYDFTIASLTCDGAFHEVDLTNVIGDVAATDVLLRLNVGTPSSPGAYLVFREAGNTASINSLVAICQNITNAMDVSDRVHLASNQHLAYLGSAALSAANVAVRGYWKPAG